MTAAERITKVCERLDKSPIQLANELDLERDRLRDIIRKNAKKMPFEVASLISRNFPFISKEWLLEEIGEMEITQEKEIEEQESASNKLINEQLVVIGMIQQQLNLQQKILEELRSSRIQEKIEWEQKRELEKAEFHAIIRELREYINHHDSWSMAAEPSPRSTPKQE